MPQDLHLTTSPVPPPDPRRGDPSEQPDTTDKPGYDVEQPAGKRSDPDEKPDEKEAGYSVQVPG